MKIILSFFCVIALAGCAVPGAKEGMTAAIITINGKAEIKYPAEPDWIPAEMGMALKEGETIRTDDRSSVVISLNGSKFKSIVTMREKTQLAFLRFKMREKTGFRRIFLDLADGKLIVTTPEIDPEEFRYEIKTPTSIVDIKRGTVFVTVEDAK